MVLIGWALALVTALCDGVANVLQAIAARSTRTSAGMDVMLLVRVLRRLPFVGGVALGLIGFTTQIIALQMLPLYVVQAVQASNLAVTAIVAVPLLHIGLGRREWIAIGMVCGGLIALGVSTGPHGGNPRPFVLGTVVLVVALLLAAFGWAAGQWGGTAGAVMLGALAGAEFGILALGARMITSPTPLSLIRQPAAWCVAVGAISGFLFLATGLQRGKVTTVSGAVVVAETVLPAVIGVVLLGDRARPGMAAVAYLGFLIALAGTLALACFGKMPSPARQQSVDGSSAEPAPTLVHRDR